MAKKNRTGHLPGMEPVSNPKINKAAAAYVKARDERMGLTKTETDRHLDLLAEIKDAGLTHYEYNGLSVDVTTSQKCKVTTAGDDDSEP